MKTLIHSLILVAILASSSFAKADDTVQLSPAASAAMIDARFSKELAKHVKAAKKHNRELRIDSITTMYNGMQTIVNFALVEQAPIIIPDTPVAVGAIVASLVSPPGSTFQVDGLWFAPEAEPPTSGASVGN